MTVAALRKSSLPHWITIGSVISIAYVLILSMPLIPPLIVVYLSKVLQDRTIDISLKLLGILLFLPFLGSRTHLWQPVTGYKVFWHLRHQFSFGLLLCRWSQLRYMDTPTYYTPYSCYSLNFFPFNVRFYPLVRMQKLWWNRVLIPRFSPPMRINKSWLKSIILPHFKRG